MKDMELDAEYLFEEEVFDSVIEEERQLKLVLILLEIGTEDDAFHFFILNQIIYKRNRNDISKPDWVMEKEHYQIIPANIASDAIRKTIRLIDSWEGSKVGINE